MNTTPSQKHSSGLRITALILAILFSWGVLISLRMFGSNGFNLLSVGLELLVVIPAVSCWWFALGRRVHKSGEVMLYALVGGVILGSIGFSIGFFGPMIFSPESNQGPLAGIFFTGPLGFIVGGLLGFIIGCIRVRRQTVKEQAGA